MWQGNQTLSQKEIQKLINLTPEQKKAWTQLARAVSQCKKANIYFYQVLESLHGLNGCNVERVDESEGYRLLGGKNENANLQWLDYPCVKTSCSWADDTHYVVTKIQEPYA